MPVILSICFFIGYFIESIFGFAGTIISLSLLAYFIDIKDAIYIAMYASSVASLSILISDHKSLNLGELKRVYKLAFPGILIGAASIVWVDSGLLLKIFAAFLILFALNGLFRPHFVFPKIIAGFLTFCGGITQGIYGTGGPFVLMAHRDKFKDKSELRATMAGFFLSANIIRFIQLYAMGDVTLTQVFDAWWVILPVGLAVALGYVIHIKISERYFKIGVMGLLLLAGIVYLLK